MDHRDLETVLDLFSRDIDIQDPDVHFPDSDVIPPTRVVRLSRRLKTTEPEAWEWFTRLAERRGWKVYSVTYWTAAYWFWYVYEQIGFAKEWK